LNWPFKPLWPFAPKLSRVITRRSKSLLARDRPAKENPGRLAKHIPVSSFFGNWLILRPPRKGHFHE
jgi:hypothetical protein